MTDCRIKNVIFDFGNVLIKWDPHNLFDKYFNNKEKSDWFLKNIFTMEWNGKMDADQTFAQVREQLTTLYPEWADAILAYDEQWDQMIGGDIKEMWNLVDRLREMGYKVFGLSNWPREKLYRTNELREHLDGYVISCFVKLSKPSQDIYKLLLDRYSLKANECVFIDDLTDNIEAANQIGIHGIVFKGYDSLLPKLNKLLNKKII